MKDFIVVCPKEDCGHECLESETIPVDEKYKYLAPFGFCPKCATIVEPQQTY